MRRIFLALAATILSVATAYAQQPDAIYKQIAMEWTVNADGTSDYHYRHEVQILRNGALTAYADKGETFVVYNPDLEEVTVNEVYTLRADGSRVDMPQNAFVYQLPKECADCGRFNHIRELAMIHTGMEIGCTVVVDYTVHRQYNLVNVDMPLPKECPVEHMRISLSLPEGQELHATLTPGAEGMTFGAFSEQRSGTTYTLDATNMIATINEPHQPSTLYPTLHIYNGTPQWTPDLNAESFTAAQDNMGQVMVSRNNIDNIVAARNYVVDNIHLNNIDPTHIGYTHATAAETWRSGCGTVVDKAVLLAAILRAEGFRARACGDPAEMVSVMVDNIEYRMSVKDKSAITVYGEAHDAVDTARVKRTISSDIIMRVIDTLEDGFYRMPLIPIKGEPSIDASNLSLVRRTPMAVQACDIVADEVYTLPKGMKMVAASTNIQQSYDGVGSISISIKQSGTKLKVKRSLKLEQSIVPQADYDNYRRLLSTWQTTNSVLLRTK